jgi:type I restriction enzyme M protein
MRKNLGSKRREIPEKARREIVRVYADMLNGGTGYGEFSTILDVADFGYREIRVERPLRLNFQATAERVARLATEKAIQKLEQAEREELLDTLSRRQRNRDGCAKLAPAPDQRAIGRILH